LATGMRVAAVVATAVDIDKAIRKHYPVS